MFDVIQNRSSSSSHVNIDIQQAGVHDAARLLREMEQSIVAKLDIKNNLFEAKAFVQQGMCGPNIGIAFMINGERMYVTSETGYYDEQSLVACLQEVSNKMVATITDTIIQTAILDISPMLMRTIRN